MSLSDLQAPLALLEQKDFGTAVDVLEEKVTALPAHLGAHVLLAYAHEGQQNWERALKSWENVHFLMPNSPLADEGKQRVLRRMEGAEKDEELSFGEPPRSDAPPTEAFETPSSAPSTEKTEEEPPPDQEESSSTESDSNLDQLRRQAEREARRGGARPGLSDEGPSVAPSSPPEEPSSTPEEQVEKLEGEDETDDLDRLIDKLQSARIDPDPDAPVDAPPPDPEDTEEDVSKEVVSETLARIHEGQKNFRKAADIYATLADQEPERADEFRKKAAEMREKVEGLDENS